MSDPICPKHGAGFGSPCYMCVDEQNREFRALLVRALKALRELNHGTSDCGRDGCDYCNEMAETRAILSDPLAVALLKEADRG